MERPDPLHVADIAGATTKQLPVRTRGDHPFNSSADIDQAMPRPRGLNTNRHTCPLNPEYVLPSFAAESADQGLPPPRDQLWTLPQTRWKPAPRNNLDTSDIEVRSSSAIRRAKLAERDTMAVADINKPQFRCEQPTTRHTDPLHPSYVYDNGPVDHIDPRVPKHGSRYPRKESEQFSLMSKDVTASESGTSLSVFSSEYPKELIKTRPTNRTDDIAGEPAVARTRRRSTTHRVCAVSRTHARLCRRAGGHALLRASPLAPARQGPVKGNHLAEIAAEIIGNNRRDHRS